MSWGKWWRGTCKRPGEPRNQRNGPFCSCHCTQRSTEQHCAEPASPTLGGPLPEAAAASLRLRPPGRGGCTSCPHSPSLPQNPMPPCWGLPLTHQGPDSHRARATAGSSRQHDGKGPCLGLVQAASLPVDSSSWPPEQVAGCPEPAGPLASSRPRPRVQVLSPSGAWL